MTKNTEYEISLLEIIKLLKSKWKLICLVSLAFVVLCGGYRIVAGLGEPHDTQLYDDYKKDTELYEYLVDVEAERPDQLMVEWKNISSDRLNNPIFSVNPYNCEYEQIVLRFEGENSNHDWTVNNWIIKADNEGLFGEQADTLSDYKSTLVLLGRCEEYVQTADTVVQIIAVKGFDTKKAADYLVKKFNQFAKEDDITISNISMSSAKGYNENVERYQQNNREKYHYISTVFTDSKNLKSSITAPVNPVEGRSIALKNIIKFCLIGFILGLVLSFVYIIFNAVRKREVISTRQVEDSFGLELLSDCSSDGDLALDVLNANLDVMTEEGSNIAIVAENYLRNIREVSDEWTSKSERTFTVCTDIFDDPESIEALKKAKGIVICVKIGKSKMDWIQRIVLKANKLNIKVLGYVLL